MKNQWSFDLDDEKKSGPVECLGITFENDDARREHFLKLLAEKLGEPEFRNTPGFPSGSDEDILRLSDPPYYTACPNPFLGAFVHDSTEPCDPETEYRREPFAVDVSVGKTDQLYRAHGYHTKVPHLAIVPSILHYTRPSDIVLDAFCGSGMTGVAAQWCGTAPETYKSDLESEWRRQGRPAPEWGPRRVVLGDLGPAATFIAANYNLPFGVDAFAREAQRILDEIEDELGWMYETLHTDGETKGRINYTVWSEVFSCPECGGDVVFLEEALDEETKRVHDEFPCPSCGARLSKNNLERAFETLIDPATRGPWKRIRLEPVLINYSVGKPRYEKAPDEQDIATLERIRRRPLPAEVPTSPFPIAEMYHGSRLEPKGFTRVHHLFLPRAAQSLAVLWRKAGQVQDDRLRNMLLFFVEQAIWGMSLLNRYQPIQQGRPGGSQVNRQLSGVYYVSSQIAEVSPGYNLQLRLGRLKRHAFSKPVAVDGTAFISTGDCAAIPLPDRSIDYVFTDPPFGENIYYADLNFLVESWHGVSTDAEPEAIIDRAKSKDTVDYQDLMRRCFEEYHRVLKPGRWMTVVFSNSRNSIWRAIQEAMGTAGFVVADVRTLDKKQGSYRQVTSSAVKQDLVISAYKPTAALAERFELGAAAPEDVWAFVSEHLHNVPVFVGRNGQDADTIAERTPQMLHDRMIAFFVQRRVAVPISGPDFLAGLAERYPPRDGMVFLPDQVAEYDRRRIAVNELRQLELFVNDEASAVQWVRQQLQRKPQPFQDLMPQFLQQIQAWAKHERTVDLREILELNFFHYDGTGPVPSQIHSYLSSNYRDYRGLDKDDPQLRAMADGRWYVPDPKKEGDLEKLRLRTMLREFEDYRTSTKRKIKQFRTEAVRAGFKHCYDEQDYQTIVEVAAKLPETVIQEDEKLLMYYHVARMRLGD
jgi:hypothetical protein